MKVVFDNSTRIGCCWHDAARDNWGPGGPTGAPVRFFFTLFTVWKTYRSSETLGGHIPLLSSTSRSMLDSVDTYNGSFPRRRAYYPGSLSAASVCDTVSSCDSLRIVQLIAPHFPKEGKASVQNAPEQFTFSSCLRSYGRHSSVNSRWA